jgi:SHS family lactate transporter-like MFS transporter
MDQQTVAMSPWRVLAQYWRVTLAAMLGWFLDAFDTMILIFLLVDLRQTFSVSLVAMGFLLTAQTWAKIVGEVAWGWGADRFGRKLAFMVGIIWFACASGLTGLAWSYESLLVIRIVFGLGFGGEWSASAALLMESVPAAGRSLASAVMMAGFEVGYFMAAVANALIYPVFGWRVLFFIGMLPALLAVFVRWGVPESPVWLARRANLAATRTRAKFSITAAGLQGWLFMFLLQFQNTAIFAFYPAFLQTVHHYTPGQIFPFAATYSVASIIGKPSIGYIASRFGQRLTLVTYLLITIPGALFFTLVGGTAGLYFGAFLMGIVANSIFGLVPHFLSQRFPTEMRSLGMGTGYGIANIGGSICSFVLPMFAGPMGLGVAMAVLIIGGSAATAAVAAIRPKHLPGEIMEEVAA